jgi:hypothetical protein
MPYFLLIATLNLSAQGFSAYSFTVNSVEEASPKTTTPGRASAIADLLLLSR